MHDFTKILIAEWRSNWLRRARSFPSTQKNVLHLNWLRAEWGKMLQTQNCGVNQFSDFFVSWKFFWVWKIIFDLSLFTGERYDFVITADQPVGAYWIQLRGLGECGIKRSQQLGILRYARGPYQPASAAPTYDVGIPQGVVSKTLIYVSTMLSFHSWKASGRHLSL